MFKFKILTIAAALTALCASCSKNDSPAAADRQEICFSLVGDGIDFNVTKATAVTSDNLSSVYWEAAASGTVKHAVSSKAVSSGKVSTGQYWPLEGATYDYKLANVLFETSTGVITADNETDIVVGTASGVTSSTSCSVTLDHIFARTGEVTASAETGFSLAGVSWTIESTSEGPGTAGTYTIGSGWGSVTSPLASKTLDSDSDLYLMPGSYNVTVSYTISEEGGGSYTETTSKTGTVNLEQGYINNIKATIGGPDATEITFSVSVAAWQTKDQNVSFGTNP